MILITLSGGLQDAYTFVERGGVFANAQTGNIVLLSSSLFSAEWGRALSYLIPISAFALGILVSALARHRFGGSAGRLHWRHGIVLAEIALLAAVAFMPESLSPLANAIVSFSCAMQVEAFRTSRGYAFASTMCIGNLKSCMESVADGLCGKEGSLKKVGYYAFVIAVFALGAGAGALLSARLSLKAILASALLLALAFLLMIGGKEPSKA